MDEQGLRALMERDERNQRSETEQVMHARGAFDDWTPFSLEVHGHVTALSAPSPFEHCGELLGADCCVRDGGVPHNGAIIGQLKTNWPGDHCRNGCIAPNDPYAPMDASLIHIGTDNMTYVCCAVAQGYGRMWCSGMRPKPGFTLKGMHSRNPIESVSVTVSKRRQRLQAKARDKAAKAGAGPEIDAASGTKNAEEVAAAALAASQNANALLAELQAEEAQVKKKLSKKSKKKQRQKDKKTIAQKEAAATVPVKQSAHALPEELDANMSGGGGTADADGDETEQQGKAARKAAKKQRQREAKAAAKEAADGRSEAAMAELDVEVEVEADADADGGTGAIDMESTPLTDAELVVHCTNIAVLRLCSAVKEGDCDKLREMLSGNGASVLNERAEVTDKGTGEKFWTTALIQAVAYNQHAAVVLLLEHSANPNLADSDGFTPLLRIAVEGYEGGHGSRRPVDLPILQTLLDCKDIAIDAVEPNTGFTAFHLACNAGNADCAVELVRHGCNTQLHGELTKRCKLMHKLALRRAQQQTVDNAASCAAPAIAADSVSQADEDAERQKKAAKKAALNRKKRDRQKAKKAAEQQLISQSELEQSELEQSHVQLQPELEVAECPAQQAEPEAERQAEPELDERKQQLQALTKLGVQQWSAAQVLEWVALADLPPESVSAAIAAMESLDFDDGEELLLLIPKTLQKKLAKHGVQDAEALAKQVIEQRDALLPGDDISESASPKSELSDILECPLCMELYCDDASGLGVPRILTKCGHTVCHSCITKMLTQVLADGNAKPYKCPTCSKVTKVAKGKAASLPRNFALAAALEAL